MAILARRALCHGFGKAVVPFWNVLFRSVAEQCHHQHVRSRHGSGTSTQWMFENLKSLWTGTHSGTGPSWPLIPPSFHRFDAMGLERGGKRRQCCVRSGASPHGADLLWSCWPPRSGVVRVHHELNSFPYWPIHGRSRNGPSSEAVLLQHGRAVGVRCSRAAPPDFSQCRWASVTRQMLSKENCEMAGSRSRARHTVCSSRGFLMWDRHCCIFRSAKKVRGHNS